MTVHLLLYVGLINVFWKQKGSVLQNYCLCAPASKYINRKKRSKERKKNLMLVLERSSEIKFKHFLFTNETTEVHGVSKICCGSHILLREVVKGAKQAHGS